MFDIIDARCNHEIFYYLRRVCWSFLLSVRMENLGYHWTDFHEI